MVMLSQDSFYRNLTQEELENVKAHNFDHPDAFDIEAMKDCLTALEASAALVGLPSTSACPPGCWDSHL